MKKKVLILGLSIVAIIIIGIFLFNILGKNFKLENKYYGKSEITEINIKTLNKLVDNKESFAVFVYQPMCIVSSDFENVLNEFISENSISIYKIAFFDLKDTKQGKNIKYYPSFIIYKKGKQIDFLDANKDEDTKYYSSVDGFKEWFTKYVKLENVNNNQGSIDNESSLGDYSSLDVTLDYVVKEKNKVNIYLFWGSGCPHCKKEFEFFEKIEEQYGKYYNLYTFETWKDKDNENLLKVFASNMEDEVNGVPYTIIGNKSFIGFDEDSKQEMIEAIEEQHKTDFDVYFDKIKK